VVLCMRCRVKAYLGGDVRIHFHMHLFFVADISPC
jgi:hypothetical protein